MNQDEKRRKLTPGDYAELASFRHALRVFLRSSEAAAADAGLTSQHYQAMLILKGWPDGEPVSISDLARQLLIKHHSAVGLVNRLVDQRLVGRRPSKLDRRKVELRLSPRGHGLVARLSETQRDELRRIGPIMKRLVSDLATDRGGEGG